MYIGICSERGNKVDDEDAFWYAVNRLLKTQEERKAFEEEFSEDILEWFNSELVKRIKKDKLFLMVIGYILRHKAWMEEFEKEFSESIVEWYYSGNWVHREDEAC